jgi:thiol-disulfide isomerase/thioredoxin
MKIDTFLKFMAIPIFMIGCGSSQILIAQEANQTPSNYMKNQNIHNLTSIQSEIIHIQENKNGFIFPLMRDKIVILEIFGKSCPHCDKQMPILSAIKNANLDKVEIIAIHAQEMMDKNEKIKFFSKHAINYPIIDGSQSINLLYFIRDTYGWDGTMPYMLVIKNGLTEFSYSGETDLDEIKKDIKSLL